MFTTDPHNEQHPEDQLGAYALDILDQAEAVQVESHLLACYRCRDTVARMQTSAAMIGESVDHLESPAALQSRILNSLPNIGVDATVPITTSIYNSFSGC